MSFAYFFLLYLFNLLIIIELEECVSTILLQHILSPFILFVILKFPNVYTSIILPPLSLTVSSPFFVYLHRIPLPPLNISVSIQ